MNPFGPWDGRDVVATVRVEAIGPDRFVSTVGQRNVNGRLFGGQPLGLALQAANETVTDRLPHMMTGQFVRPPRMDIPVEIAVERVFDGGTFSSRRIVLSRDGEAMFYAHASYQADLPGLEHSPTMPDVPPPEDCLTFTLVQERLGDTLFKGALRRTRPPPAIDLRLIDAAQYLRDSNATYRRRARVRCPSAAGSPAATQRAILAYLSDYWLAETGVIAHETLEQADFRMASLNQAMRFHRAFRTDEWLLVDCDSPTAQHGRALGRAAMYAGGVLVASAVQEVMMRAR